MIVCPRHASRLCGALEITGAASARHAITSLIAAASDVWLVDPPCVFGPLTSPRLGGLTGDRVGDREIAAALDRSRRVVTEGGPVASHGPRLRPPAPTQTTPRGHPQDPLVPSPIWTQKDQAAVATTSGRPARHSGKLPEPARRSAHRAVAAVEVDRRIASRSPLATLAGSRMVFDRPVRDGSSAAEAGRATVARTIEDNERDRHQTSAVPGRSGPRRPAARGSDTELAALVHMWDAGDDPASVSPRLVPPSQSVLATARREAVTETRQPAEATSDPTVTERPESALGDLHRGDVDIPDLDAEARVLELIERALRSEARRQGVALPPGGLE